MAGCDLSEFNQFFPPADWYLIRLSHGLSLDNKVEKWNDLAVRAGKARGFYHVLESEAIENEAAFFKDHLAQISPQFTFGSWLDIARGDLPSQLISTQVVDRFRAVEDAGLYVNDSALNAMPEYKRFERLWRAFPSNLGTLQPTPQGRWLIWQAGQWLGTDIDVVADEVTLIAPQTVDPKWTAFHWPNL